MSRPPKSKDETFFSGGGGRRVAIGGIFFAAATLAGYAIGNTFNYQTACTMAYLILSVSQLVYVLEIRNNRGIFREGITRFMAVSVVASVALVAVVAFIPPLQKIFGLTSMPYYMYLIAFALSTLPTLVHEGWRVVNRYKPLRKASVRRAKI